jgi:hypothetical protein
MHEQNLNFKGIKETLKWGEENFSSKYQLDLLLPLALLLIFLIIHCSMFSGNSKRKMMFEHQKIVVK